MASIPGDWQAKQLISRPSTVKYNATVMLKTGWFIIRILGGLLMISWLDQLKFGKQAGYETIFKRQNTKLVGKTGVILAEIGMPEGYDVSFYNRYMYHVFQYSIPFFIRPLVLVDRGIALIDPENPLAREAFSPKQLIDAHGSFTNRSDKAYVDCKVTWRKPSISKNPWDHGYFIYTEEGKGGAPDLCQKTSAKVKGWYFDRLLPNKKVPWAYQHRLIYKESAEKLRHQFPNVHFIQAFYSNEDSLYAAANELLNKGCQTIVYQCYSNPVYSDFEEYATTIPCLASHINGRAKLIVADQIGNQRQLAHGIAQRLQDVLEGLPARASIFVILSKHGHPFKKETQDQRAYLYRQPVESTVREVMANYPGKWELTWSDDEFADAYWDPKNTKLDTRQAHSYAIQKNFDYAIELPTEFFGENTDTMIFHAMKKYDVFDDYDRNRPVEYYDWDQPMVRTFHNKSTKAIYAGCLVGPYRSFVVDAIVSSLSEVLGDSKTK
jgi:hypothetical protein